MKKIAISIGMVGLASVAAYLETHGGSGGFLWLGVVLAFLSL